MELAISAAEITRGAMRRTYPSVICKPEACEIIVQMGFFFDGTGNNRDKDRSRRRQSNIARLAIAYPEQRERHTHQFYIAGVGTDFPQLDIEAEGWLGTGLGVGCEIRMHYACATLLNTLHHTLTLQDMYPLNHPQLLQEAGSKLPYQADLGVEGLQIDRVTLHNAVRRSKVVIKECLIDVFGFSRGASTARAFCNRIQRQLVNNSLCDIPITFRFLGLFDTVAASGFNGHAGWAAPENLTIPERVRNCVHMVAMHELRKKFPVELLDQLKPSWIELAYPGSHSDVGGGYVPGDFGVPQAPQLPEREALQLAQIPLNHMHAYALDAGVPLRRSDDLEDFAVSSKLAADYKRFADYCGSRPRHLHACLEEYLAWRWHNRSTYPNSNQAKAASREHREILLKYNDWLARDGANMALANSPSDRILRMTSRDYRHTRSQQESHLAPEARQVFDRVRKAKPLPAAIANFFDCYVHDSLAGFDLKSIESTGYWRYRRAFRGSALGFIADNTEATALAELA